MECVVKHLSSCETDSAFTDHLKVDNESNLQAGDAIKEGNNIWKSVIRMFSDSLWLASQPPNVKFDLQFYSNITKLSESESQPCPSPIPRSQNITVVITPRNTPIGLGSGQHIKQMEDLFCSALDSCLLTDEEYNIYEKKHTC